MENNISFKSTIRIVSPYRFNKISQNIFWKNGEFICFNDLNAFTGVDFQAYRIKMKEGFTKGVRSCTSGLFVSNNKKEASFFHIYNSKENIKLLPELQKRYNNSVFNGNNGILIGAKKGCPLSIKLFNIIEKFSEANNVPTTKMKSLAPTYEADIAYCAVQDIVYLCVKDILNPNNYAKTENDLKKLFKQFQLSTKDKILSINPIKEFFENLLSI